MNDFESAGNVASGRHWCGRSDPVHCRKFERSAASWCRRRRLDPLAPLVRAAARRRRRRPRPAGIDPQLFARAKAALDQHQIYPRDTIGIVDFSQAVERAALPCRRSSPTARSRATGSATAAAPIPPTRAISSASLTTSAPTRRRTGPTSPTDYYDGKYGLSLRVRGLDWSNSNAEPRAIVIHNAWYAEDDMIPLHGQLGRSEGCFAMSRKSQYEVMRTPRRRPHDLRRQARLSGGARGSRRTRTLSYS